MGKSSMYIGSIQLRKTANKKGETGKWAQKPCSCESPEKSGQSVSHDNLATLSPGPPSSENDTAKIQKILQYDIIVSIWKKESK